MEVIELQCNSVVKAKFENVGIKTFHQYFGPTFEDHVNVRWYLCLRTTVLFDELKSLNWRMRIST